MKSIDVFKENFEKNQSGFDLVLDFRSMTVDQIGQKKTVNGKEYDDRQTGKFFTARNGGSVVISLMPNFNHAVNDFEN